MCIGIKRFAIFVMVAMALYVSLLDNAFAALPDLSSIVGKIGTGAVFVGLTPNPLSNGGNSFSAGDTPTGGTLCSIIGMVNSNVGQGLATLAVIFLGLAALFGQVKWTQAVLLGVGIAMIMGASSLVASLPSSTTTGGTTITSSGVDASLKSDGTVNSCN